MLIHKVKVHGPEYVGKELLPLICVNNLLVVDGNILVFSADLNVASIWSHYLIHQCLHRADLRLRLKVLSRNLMDDQRVLRVQIDC